MMSFDWRAADPIASVFVAILIAKSGYGVLKETFHILMEGAPENVDLGAAIDAIKSAHGVKSVHDLHVWSIASGANAMCAHVVVDGELSVREAEKIVREVSHALERLGIAHSTLQIESERHGHGEELICEIGSPNPSAHIGHRH